MARHRYKLENAMSLKDDQCFSLTHVPFLLLLLLWNMCLISFILFVFTCYSLWEEYWMGTKAFAFLITWVYVCKLIWMWAKWTKILVWAGQYLNWLLLEWYRDTVIFCNNFTMLSNLISRKTLNLLLRFYILKLKMNRKKQLIAMNIHFIFCMWFCEVICYK